MVAAHTFQPPLRAAVCWCVQAAAGACITADGVAMIAQVAPDRALAFLSILVARGAVVAEGGGRYRAGDGWCAWFSAPVRNKPKGGMSTAADELDTMRRALCQGLAAKRRAVGISQRELSARAGVSPAYMQRAEACMDPPPACVAVLLARELGTTVDQLVTQSPSLGA